MQALPGTLSCGCCDCRYGHDRWALRTRLTCSIRLRISASTHMRTENVAAFEKIAFFCSKCYNRNIPNTKGRKLPCQDRHGAVKFVAYHRSIHSVPTGARIPSRSCWRWTNTRSFGWLTWSSKPMSSVPRKWIFPALPCRRFTKAHGAKSQRALSMGSRCTSPEETIAFAEGRRQPIAAVSAGCREPTWKN